MLFLKPKKNINDELKEYRATEGAVLLDVRNPHEYSFARLPGSVNIPLSRLKQVKHFFPDKETPIFVYCVSGGRADRAVKRLRRMGYKNVKSIGGVNGYRGELEQG